MKKSTDDPPVLTLSQRASSPELGWVDSASRLLDTRFRIPGTRVRFGADFLMGLIPGAGDLLSMGFSGLLIATMAKNGASAKLVVRMLLNVVLDTVVGAVPVLGNLFDLFFKANYRNLELMREYSDEGKHAGSIWPLLAAVVVVMGVLCGATVWLLATIYRWFFS